jgi:hypothetical protein
MAHHDLFLFRRGGLLSPVLKSTQLEGTRAMGLDCCGIGGFYDNEVAELLKLNQESRLLYLVAVGPIKSKKC